MLVVVHEVGVVPVVAGVAVAAVPAEDAAVGVAAAVGDEVVGGPCGPGEEGPAHCHGVAARGHDRVGRLLAVQNLHSLENKVKKIMDISNQ